MDGDGDGEGDFDGDGDGSEENRVCKGNDKKTTAAKVDTDVGISLIFRLCVSDATPCTNLDSFCRCVY